MSDTERYERRQAKADKLEVWAANKRREAARLIEANEPYRGDIAFNTQPGHIPERARAIRRTERAGELIAAAEEMEAKANRLRQIYKGAAEERRRGKREDTLSWIKPGIKVVSPLWGEGIVLKVFKKTARIETERGIFKEGLHWLQPA